MQSYTSRAFELKKGIDPLFQLISKPTNLAPLAQKFDDKLPVKDLKLTDDEISFSVSPLGEIIMKRTEVLEPNMVKYESVKSPVPVKLVLNLSKESEEVTLGQVTVETNVPPFLRGMVKGKVQPALEKLADTLELIDFDRLSKGTLLSE